MNVTIRIALFSTCLILAFSSSFAQTADSSTSVTAKTAISIAIEPHFLITNAGRLNVELQKPGGKFAYIIVPEIYGGEIVDAGVFRGISDKDPDKIRGFGLGLFHKYKFKPSVTGPYLAYGLTYRNLDITYNTEGYIRYTEDELTYYKYGDMEDVLKINSYLISGLAGYQKTAGIFMFDIYVGLGYKSSNKKSLYPAARKYDRSVFDIAYTGGTMVFGIKLGFQLQ